MQLSMNVLRCPDHVAPETRLVSGGEFHVGRGPDVDWVLPDPDKLLSKRHFAVAFRGGQWHVADVSTNGTFMNTDPDAIGRGTTRVLRDGDRLRLGAYEIEVRLVEQAAESGFGQGGRQRTPLPMASRGDASPFDDPLGDHPFAPPPPPRPAFGESPYAGSGIGSTAARLPDNFDPLAPDGDDPLLHGSFQGPVQSDHSSFLDDAIVPPPVSPAHPPAGFGGQPAASQFGNSQFGGAPSGGALGSQLGGSVGVPLGGQPSGRPGGGPIPEGDILSDDWDKALDALAPPGTSSTPSAYSPPGGAPAQSFPPFPPMTPDVTPSMAPPPPAQPQGTRPQGLPPQGLPPQGAAPVVRQRTARPSPPPVETPIPSLDPYPEEEPPGGPDPFADLPPTPPKTSAHQDRAADGWISTFEETSDHRAPPIASPVPTTAPAPIMSPDVAPPAKPAIPAGAAQADSGLIDAFLSGAGLPGPRPADPTAAMKSLGRAFRAMVTGLRAVMIARGNVKREFRIEQTMIRAQGNNPLKFAANDDDALAALLGVGRRADMTAAAAIEDSLRDMGRHEVAVTAAMQVAVRTLMDEIAPEKIRAGSDHGGMAVLPAQRKARAWDAYEARHGAVVQALSDDFDSVFGKAFAQAYERALEEMAAREHR